LDFGSVVGVFTNNSGATYMALMIAFFTRCMFALRLGDLNSKNGCTSFVALTL
jgi:hypothetical protein